MNRKQRNIILRLVIVLSITGLMVLAISNFKEIVNRSEATMAIEQLSGLVFKYKNHYGSFPPVSYLDGLAGQVQGSARLGTVVYRADCIKYCSGSGSILMYVKKEYSGFLQPSGYIAARLDGSVDWLSIEKFEDEMALEDSQCEIALNKVAKTQEPNDLKQP
jgi:hypothetical protein